MREENVRADSTYFSGSGLKGMAFDYFLPL